MKQSKLFENTSHYKTMRERAFESDLGCNATLIGFIWELTKGLTKIASDLRRIADELESYTKEKEPKCVEGVIE